VAAAVALALVAGGFVGWRLTRPPSFHEPASVAGLGRALDDVAPEALRRESVPGAAVAVVRSGRVAWVRGYGVADAARRAAVRRARCSRWPPYRSRWRRWAHCGWWRSGAWASIAR
jgi:CubicO group peptidase (beta-lactamase class C family)